MEWYVDAIAAGWLPADNTEVTDAEGEEKTVPGWKVKQQKAVNKVLARERTRADTLETDLTVMTADRDKLKAGAKDGDVDATLLAENEKLTTQLAAKDDKILTLDGTNAELRFGNVTRDVKQAALVAGFDDSADAVVHLKSRLSPTGKVLDENGKTRINADGEEMSITELVSELAASKPYLLKKSQRKGTNFDKPGEGPAKPGDLDAQIVEAEKGTTRSDAIRSISLKRQRLENKTAQ